jgi:hypothetical protein
LNRIVGNRRKRRLEFAATIAFAMSDSGMGVRQIPPRAATRWQGNQHSPERRESERAAEDAPQSEAERPPPAPGTGKLVDRLA